MSKGSCSCPTARDAAMAKATAVAVERMLAMNIYILSSRQFRESERVDVIEVEVVVTRRFGC